MLKYFTFRLDFSWSADKIYGNDVTVQMNVIAEGK